MAKVILHHRVWSAAMNEKEQDGSMVAAPARNAGSSAVGPLTVASGPWRGLRIPAAIFLVVLMIVSSIQLAGASGEASVAGSSRTVVAKDMAATALSAASSSMEVGEGPAHGIPVHCSTGAASGVTGTCSSGAVSGARPHSTPSWTDLAFHVPSARFSASMTYDYHDGYILLFGGGTTLTSNAPGLGDTWTFDMGTWTNITSKLATAPSPRYGAAMTYDATDGYVLLFGGLVGANVVSGDTWTYQAGTWTNITATATGAPPPRTGSAMTYDPTDGYVVLFGGMGMLDGTFYTSYGGTWTFSGGHWTSMTGGAVAPPPRDSAGIAYDAKDGYVVLYGGEDYNITNTSSYLKDTWTFSGGAWTNITSGQSPGGRDMMGMSYDAALGKVLLFGGCHSMMSAGGPTGPEGPFNPTCTYAHENDSWTFSAGRWTNTTASFRPPGGYDGPAMTYDPSAPDVLYFSPSLVVGSGPYYVNGTWTYSAGGWGHIDEMGPRYYYAMTYDAADRYVVAFGGMGSSGWSGGWSDNGNQTWTFRAGVWTQIPTPSGLTGRRAPSMTYDTMDGYVLLFGGITQIQGQTNLTALWDTWTFRAGTWTSLNLAQSASPPGRGGASMVYDAGDGYVLLFGGENITPGLFGGVGVSMDDTWTYSAGTWTNITASTGLPPIRQYAAMAYDAADGYVLLFGGWDVNLTSYNDTWTFHGGKWTQRTLPNSPPPLSSAVMTYDAADGYVLLFSGEYPPTPTCLCMVIGELAWKFSGGNWTNITASSGPLPPGRYASAMTFDAADNYVLMASGLPSVSSLVPALDTWTYGWTPLKVILRATPETGFANLTVNLTATVTGGGSVYSFYWWFGDYNSSSGTLPYKTYNYTRPGTYLATVQANEGFIGTTATYVSNVAVLVLQRLPLKVNASSSVTSGPAPLSVSFYGYVSGGSPPYSFSWDFGDSSALSAAESPAHTYNAPGTYLANFTVKDNASVTGTRSITITVTPSTGSQLMVTAAANRTTGTAPLPVTFNGTVTGGKVPYTYSWAFGDGGTGTVRNPTYIYHAAGTYTAWFNVTDASGTKAASHISIRVTTSGLLSATAEPSVRSGSAPLSVSFTGVVTGGKPPYTFAWSFGDGGTSTIESPSHSYKAAGNYAAWFNVTDSTGAKASNSVKITVTGTSGGGGGGFPILLAGGIAGGAAAAVGTMLFLHFRGRPKVPAPSAGQAPASPPSGSPPSPPAGADK